MNLFRGKAITKQIFPYPLNLDSDRKETLQMIMPATEKFLKEVNDVVKYVKLMVVLCYLFGLEMTRPWTFPSLFLIKWRNLERSGPSYQ